MKIATHVKDRTGRILRTTLGFLLLTLALAHQTQAQLISPLRLNYSFSVPVVKVVPNSCTGGYVLVKGAMKLTITTIQGGQVPFVVAVKYISGGTGQDALADGTLILNGSQKADYLYSSQTVSDAGFPDKPQDFAQALPIRDFLVRSDGDKSDELLVDTAIALTFTNGVPAAPVLQGLSVACSAAAF